MEVFPGIHQVVLPLPGYALNRINVYLVRRDDGWLLVDCGWNTPEAYGALSHALEELKIHFTDIKQIVITHVHPDHYGMVGRLKELSGCSLMMGRRDAELIDSRYLNTEPLLRLNCAFLVKHGVPEEDAAVLRNASLPVLKFVVPAQPDQVLEGGETVRAGKFNFEVIWAPGHSPGHICLYDRSHKILLAGDQVLARQSPNVSLHAQQQGNPLGDFLNSLHKLDQLDVSLVLSGHDDVFTDLHSRVKELYAHHEHRNAEILGLFGGDSLTAYELAPRIGWSTKGGPWAQLPSLDKRLSVLETLAHLEYLRSQRKVGRRSSGGILRYKKR